VVVKASLHCLKGRTLWKGKFGRIKRDALKGRGGRGHGALLRGVGWGWVCGWVSSENNRFFQAAET